MKDMTSEERFIHNVSGATDNRKSARSTLFDSAIDPVLTFLRASVNRLKSLVWPPRKYLYPVIYFVIGMFVLDTLKSGFVYEVVHSATGLSPEELVKLKTFCYVSPDASNCKELIEKRNGTYVSPQDKSNKETKADLREMKAILHEMARADVKTNTLLAGLKRELDQHTALKSGDPTAVERINERIRQLQAALDETERYRSELKAKLDRASRKMSADMKPGLGTPERRSPAILSTLRPDTQVPVAESDTENPATGSIRKTTAQLPTYMRTSMRDSRFTTVSNSESLATINQDALISKKVEAPNIQPIINDPIRIAEFQMRANEIGYNAGPVDGIFGEKSRAALMSINAHQNFPGGPYLTATQLEYVKVQTAGLNQVIANDFVGGLTRSQPMHVVDNNTNVISASLSPQYTNSTSLMTGPLDHNMNGFGNTGSMQSMSVSAFQYDKPQSNFGIDTYTGFATPVTASTISLYNVGSTVLPNGGLPSISGIGAVSGQVFLGNSISTLSNF